MRDIKEETLANLAGRLNGQQNQLTKKSGKDNSAEAINMLETVSRKKTELQSLVDVCKVAVAFSKNRTRKRASLLADKLHEMRSSVVANNMVPICLSSHSRFCSVLINTNDPT